jgi:F-type H+-transporting ATPase subunit delta
MKLSYSLATRYTDAFLEILQKNDKMSNLENYIEAIQNIIDKINSDSVFNDMINSPLLPKDYITKKIYESSKIEDKLFEKFIHSLVLKSRQELLFFIVKILNNYNLELKKLIKAEIITAKPIDSKNSEDLKNILKNKTGRDVILKTSLDESLIGGIQLYVEDKYYDYSIKGYLDSIKRSYAQTGGD